MTTPAPSGGPSPLRVGGLALIGVGVIAALIGLATLLPGGNGPGTAAPTTTTAPTATVAPSGAPPSGTTVPVPSFGATTTNGLAAPGSPGTGGTPGAGGAAEPGGTGGAGTGGAGTGGAAAGAGAAGTGGAGTGGAGTAALKVPVRVYNNSTIKGLAARAADDYRAAGWQVEVVANYPYGIIPTSTVYYRPGTTEQSAAEDLGNEFGLRVEPRFAGLNDASPGLIVIVTNDYQKR